MTIRFHLDENVHGGIALGLRSHGIDVTTTLQAGLLEASDTEQLEYCHNVGRVLVTHDNDFCKHHAAGVSHAGIAYSHRTKYSVGEHLRLLILLHACLTAEEMEARLEFL